MPVKTVPFTVPELAPLISQSLTWSGPTSSSTPAAAAAGDRAGQRTADDDAEAIVAGTADQVLHVGEAGDAFGRTAAGAVDPPVDASIRSPQRVGAGAAVEAHHDRQGLGDREGVVARLDRRPRRPARPAPSDAERAGDAVDGEPQEHAAVGRSGGAADPVERDRGAVGRSAVLRRSTVRRAAGVGDQRRRSGTADDVVIASPPVPVITHSERVVGAANAEDTGPGLRTRSLRSQGQRRTDGQRGAAVEDRAEHDPVAGRCRRTGCRRPCR